MRVSYNWLRELVPSLSASPADVADRLAAAGLAVDGITTRGGALSEVRVARVVALEPHPKRSGLRLVTVDHGAGQQRVVCGASNVPEPGGLVVLAGLGAKLPVFPEPLTAREIGGVPSEGMLCSESELGLSEGASGLLLPEAPAKPGQTLLELLPSAADTIFELDVTPNRPDALGHVGVARELAALYDLPLVLPPAGPITRHASEELSACVSVENEDTERCPHYGAGVVLSVSVARSPAWLRYRLESLGIRAISNVVDVTNLLLLERGHPLHAFDLDRVRGARIVIRRARAEEPFTTLDGVARTLDPDDLVIADGEGPSALAGIMGGADSEIRESTTRVLLECAYFAPRGVRRTARRHGMHTESSHRFERGVDWGAVPDVLERAKFLLHELASGSVVRSAIHAKGTLPERPRIPLRSARLDALLGVEVPFAEARAILGRLGFAELETQGDSSQAKALFQGASFRPDVSREVDLIEEVARARGLDRIPTRLPAIAPQSLPHAGEFERRVADTAVALGLSEALTYAFVSPSDLAKVGAPPAIVKLSNPLSEERSVLRTSLVPALLDALGRARRRGELSVRLFSLGATFSTLLAETRGGTRPRQDGDVGKLPDEPLGFAAVLAGPRREHLALNPPDVDVYDGKALALELVERLSGRKADVRLAPDRARSPLLHPRGSAEVLVEGAVVGRLGPLHPDVIAAFDLGASAVLVELDLEAVERLGSSTPRYRPIPRVPAITRDLSLVVKDDVMAGNVAEVLERAAGELCESLEVVADFRGSPVPSGQRSLTFRVVYRDPKARRGADDGKTLTDQDVDAVERRMLDSARNELGATLRA